MPRQLRDNKPALSHTESSLCLIDGGTKSCNQSSSTVIHFGNQTLSLCLWSTGISSCGRIIYSSPNPIDAVAFHPKARGNFELYRTFTLHVKPKRFLKDFLKQYFSVWFVGCSLTSGDSSWPFKVPLCQRYLCQRYLSLSPPKKRTNWQFFNA